MPPPAGLIGYRLTRSELFSVVDVSAGVFYYTFSGLTPANYYLAGVQRRFADGSVGDGTLVNFTTLSSVDPVIAPEPPPVIGTLEAYTDLVTQTSIRARWVDQSPPAGVTGYRVGYNPIIDGSQRPGHFVTVASDIRSQNFPNLLQGALYRFSVVRLGPAGEVPVAVEASTLAETVDPVIVIDPMPPPPISVERPHTPSILLDQVTQSRIEFRVEAGMGTPPDTWSYTVVRASTGAEAEAGSGIAWGASNSRTVTGLAANTEYRISVTVRNAGGAAQSSRAVSTSGVPIIPEPPVVADPHDISVTARATSATSAEVRWTVTSPLAATTGYRVVLFLDGSEVEDSGTLGLTTLQHDFYGLTPDEEYRARVYEWPFTLPLVSFDASFATPTGTAAPIDTDDSTDEAQTGVDTVPVDEAIETTPDTSSPAAAGEYSLVVTAFVTPPPNGLLVPVGSGERAVEVPSWYDGSPEAFAVGRSWVARLAEGLTVVRVPTYGYQLEAFEGEQVDSIRPGVVVNLNIHDATTMRTVAAKALCVGVTLQHDIERVPIRLSTYIVLSQTAGEHARWGVGDWGQDGWGR